MDTLARARTWSTAALKDARDACRRLLHHADPPDACAELLGIVEFVLWERRTRTPADEAIAQGRRLGTVEGPRAQEDH